MKQTIPVKKNDEVELKIDAYTSEGFGIGRIDGYTVFVPYALKNEVVKVHIVKVGKGFGVGKLLEIIEPNQQSRADICCEQYDKCGGCDMQHMKYAEQLVFKRERVMGALRHLGGLRLEDDTVYPTLASQSELRYRNKASFPFAEVDGKVRAGFFASRSHRLVPISDCPIQLIDTVKAVRITESWANKYKLSAFDEAVGSGILRHLVVRSAGEHLLVTVVTSGSALPFSDKLYELLKAELPQLAGLVHNINNTATNVILGNSYKTLFGDDTLCDKICGLKFNVRTPSFLQVNHDQTERLYQTVIDFLCLSGNESVYDVYCGIGTISLMLAKYVKSVVGIESVNEAVEDARMNAKQNGITNAEFILDSAEDALPKLVAQGKQIDAVVIDPPRKGCEIEVLNAIIDSGTKKLVYVSCNPETLARDARILSDAGFTVEKVQPVDMFPQTCHVETVVVMSREK